MFFTAKLGTFFISPKQNLENFTFIVDFFYFDMAKSIFSLFLMQHCRKKVRKLLAPAGLQRAQEAEKPSKG